MANFSFYSLHHSVFSKCSVMSMGYCYNQKKIIKNYGGLVNLQILHIARDGEWGSQKFVKEILSWKEHHRRSLTLPVAIQKIFKCWELSKPRSWKIYVWVCLKDWVLLWLAEEMVTEEITKHLRRVLMTADGPIVTYSKVESCLLGRSASHLGRSSTSAQDGRN